MVLVGIVVVVIGIGIVIIIVMLHHLIYHIYYWHLCQASIYIFINFLHHHSSSSSLFQLLFGVLTVWVGWLVGWLVGMMDG